MIETHEKNTISKFLGLYARGDSQNYPLGACIDVKNINFENGEAKVRPGFTQDLLGTAAGTAGRDGIFMWEGRPAPFSPTLIYFDATAGAVIEGNGGGALVAGIGDITARFRAVTLNGRLYFVVSSIGPKDGLYVWDGLGTCHLAMGLAPVGATLAGAVGAAGKVERGTYVFKVLYETDTGFITPPGDTQVAIVNTNGGFQINITGIPVGPPGTVKRHIICSKGTLNYNGDTKNRTFYFVPGGTINDNVAVAVTVDFYNADLVNEASEYIDQLASWDSSWDDVQAPGGLTIYGKRLILYKNCTIYVSKAGEPESFDTIDNLISVGRDLYDEPITAAAEYHNQLFIWTPTRTYATYDNGDIPANWEVRLVDNSQGAIDCGVASVFQRVGNVTDKLIVANINGLHKFTGVYEDNLANNIIDKWITNLVLSYTSNAGGGNPEVYQTSGHYSNTQLCVDSFEDRIYVRYVIGGIGGLLVCDYTEGMTEQTVKWSYWEFTGPNPAVHVPFFYVLYRGTEGSEFRILLKNLAGTSYSQWLLSDLQNSDSGVPINAYIKFDLPGEPDCVNHFAGLQLRVKSSSIAAPLLQATVNWMDEVRTATVRTFTLATAPGKEHFRLINVVSERLGLKLFVNNQLDHRFKLQHFTYYFKQLWNRGAWE
jgi:hypothetical protein